MKATRAKSGVSTGRRSFSAEGCLKHPVHMYIHSCHDFMLYMISRRSVSYVLIELCGWSLRDRSNYSITAEEVQKCTIYALGLPLPRILVGG